MDPMERAEVLVEALPYIQRFDGATMVIKYGGHAMVSEELKLGFARDVTLLRFVGIRPVIVHGGGPQISELLKKLSIEPVFVDGMRITDERTMEVVEMVLGGKLNKDIVGLITRAGGRAVGLSGKDGELLKAKRIRYKTLDAQGMEREIDMGLVGEVEKVDPTLLERLTQDGFIPVIAPLAAGPGGLTLNLNADTAAGHIAAALNADKLILLTDTKGVLDEKGELISTLRASELDDMIKKGVIKAGMIPKVRCCLEALRGGAKKAHIIDGRIRHSILLEIFTDQGIGTEIILDN